MQRALAWANLSLLVLYPVAWNAPLMRAGLLPLFGLSEISVISGIQELWQSELFLAVVVTFFALVAPYIKTIGTALLDFDLLDARFGLAFAILAKLAMADVFLIALYIVVAQGVGVGRVEAAWGLYLFTGCILASIAIQILRQRAVT
ncbi:MAG: paraquat-inducible protein A [Pseudomonadota bacterium]